MARFNWRRLVQIFEGPPELARPGQVERGATALGPDFPSSSGDRERGKFRKSKYPRLVLVGVSNDDETPITQKTEEVLERISNDMNELLQEIRLLRQDMTG